MKFKDIPGHEEVKRRLRQMADADCIPHALLFEGPEGVGKLSMARVFSQYIHCQNRQPDGEPCGDCPSCRQHQTDNNPDLFYVFPVFKKGNEQTVYCDEYHSEWLEFIHSGIYASFNNWVDILNPGTKQPVIYNSEGNVIIQRINRKSYSSKYKIMIMWLPEKMKTECANRLLKMIEEPFRDTILLFVSNHSEQILPTIYSRVQRIGMKRLPDYLVADFLTENFATEAQATMAIATLAEGSCTKAVSLMSLESDNAIFLDYFKQLMRLAYNKDVRGLKIWSEDVADLKREGCNAFLTYLMRMIRENFIYNIGRRQLSYMTESEEVFSSKFSPFVNERNVEGIAQEAERAAYEISRNANAKIVLFDFAIKMIVALRM